MTIEVLYFAGCPNHEPTVQLVREVVETLGVSLEVHEVEISDHQEAEALRFIGSPSVRVDGRDIEPGADDRTEFGFGCRIYGTSGIPPRDLLIAALQES
ncbi:MAG: thioredoxin family protein [Deltaproteobacteria bacterium]|nr:thioredoxin family protein [Deltaproteobacteria bacterium]MBW2388279.1 thioredoxin family protein [Deltaproteobacteria bacterium]MBW2725250.1 thioredoxin family protein [Deltaproteobacteria bacterium]